MDSIYDISNIWAFIDRIDMYGTKEDGSDLEFAVPDLESDLEKLISLFENREDDESVIMYNFLLYYTNKISKEKMEINLKGYDYIYDSRYSWQDIVNGYLCFNNEREMYEAECINCQSISQSFYPGRKCKQTIVKSSSNDM